MKPPDARIWPRVERIFGAAVELPPAERAAYLDGACSDDRELREEVADLLAADAGGDDFLALPVLWPPPTPGGLSGGETPAFRAGDLVAGGFHPTFAADDLVAGRFRVVRFLAVGGMGEVYEVYDRELREHLALKTVRPELAGSPAAIERFRREVHLARQVTHASVCRCYDIFHHDSPALTVLTMELLRGETLRERIRRAGRLPADEALSIVRQVTRGLAAAHAVGVIHRDLKSSNVVLTSEGDENRAVVTDFGLACLAVGPPEIADAAGDAPPASPDAPALTTHGNVLGTPAYMAPEQLTGGEVTPATDIYALGGLMYEMVTGRRPFEDVEDPYQRLNLDPEPPRSHVSTLDARWNQVILRCLRRSPAERFQDCRQIPRALTRIRPERALLAVAGGVLLLLTALLALGVLPLRSEAVRLYDEGLERWAGFELPPALDLLNRSARLDGSSAEVHLALADAWRDLGDDVKAAQEIRLAFDRRAQLPDEQQQLVAGRYLLSTGQTEVAVTALRALFASSPGLESGLGLAAALDGEEARAHLDDLRLLPSTASEDPRVDLAEARVALDLGSYERARQATVRAAELGRVLNARWLVARARLLESKACRKAEPAIAAQIARDALRLFEQENDVAGQADALLVLGNLAKDSDDVEAADRFFQQAHRLYIRQQHLGGQVKAQNLRAILLHTAGRSNEADALTAEAVDVAREIHQQIGIDKYLLSAQFGRGYVLQARGDLQGALAAFEEALTVARRLDDRGQMSDLLNNLGIAHQYLGDLSQALRMYQESLDLLRQGGDSSKRVRNLNNIGNLHRASGDLEAAQRAYDEATEILSGLDRPSLRIKNLEGSGLVLLAMGDTGEARRRFEEEIEIYGEIKPGKDWPTPVWLLGKVALAAGDAGRAEKLARRAARSAEALGLPTDELTARTVLAWALIRQGRIDAAREVAVQCQDLAAGEVLDDLRLKAGLEQVIAHLAMTAGDPGGFERVERILAEAEASGRVALQLELRLTMAELALAASYEDASERLRTLERDAEARGFHLIAALARRQLPSGPP